MCPDSLSLDLAGNFDLSSILFEIIQTMSSVPVDFHQDECATSFPSQLLQTKKYDDVLVNYSWFLILGVRTHLLSEQNFQTYRKKLEISLVERKPQASHFLTEDFAVFNSTISP